MRRRPSRLENRPKVFAAPRSGSLRDCEAFNAMDCTGLCMACDFNGDCSDADVPHDYDLAPEGSNGTRRRSRRGEARAVRARLPRAPARRQGRAAVGRRGRGRDLRVRDARDGARDHHAAVLGDRPDQAVREAFCVISGAKEPPSTRPTARVPHVDGDAQRAARARPRATRAGAGAAGRPVQTPTRSALSAAVAASLATASPAYAAATYGEPPSSDVRVLMDDVPLTDAASRPERPERPDSMNRAPPGSALVRPASLRAEDYPRHPPPPPPRPRPTHF